MSQTIGIMIDPSNETFTKVKFSAEDVFNEAKAMGGYDLAYIQNLSDQVCLVIDDEGLLKPNAYYTLGYDRSPMAGKGFLFGRDTRGDICSLPWDWLMHFLRPDNREKHVTFYKSDLALEAGIQAGKVDRPRNVVSSLGPDFKPIPGTENVIGEWHPRLTEDELNSSNLRITNMTNIEIRFTEEPDIIDIRLNYASFSQVITSITGLYRLVLENIHDNDPIKEGLEAALELNISIRETLSEFIEKVKELN